MRVHIPFCPFCLAVHTASSFSINFNRHLAINLFGPHIAGLRPSVLGLCFLATSFFVLCLRVAVETVKYDFRFLPSNDSHQLLLLACSSIFSTLSFFPIVFASNVIFSSNSILSISHATATPLARRQKESNGECVRGGVAIHTDRKR